MADTGTFNVVVLGVGFLLVFTAFNTCVNVEVSLKQKSSILLHVNRLSF